MEEKQFWKQPITVEVYGWFGEDHLARDLFIHLLIKARITDMTSSLYYNGKPFTLKRGQVIFGRNEYGKLLRCSPSGTRRALDRLAKVYSKVTSKSTSDYTVVTISAFDELIKMNKQKDKQVTSEYQASDTNKNDNNDKNDKNKSVYTPEFEKFWQLYPTRNGAKVGKKTAFRCWQKLNSTERNEIITAVNNYSLSHDVQRGYAKDPERFFKNDIWKDWINYKPEANDGNNGRTDTDYTPEDIEKEARERLIRVFGSTDD